jgi:hypothetical protein
MYEYPNKNSKAYKMCQFLFINGPRTAKQLSTTLEIPLSTVHGLYAAEYAYRKNGSNLMFLAPRIMEFFERGGEQPAEVYKQAYVGEIVPPRYIKAFTPMKPIPRDPRTREISFINASGTFRNLGEPA